MATSPEKWDEVKADFLASGLSYKKLAEKHGVALPTLKRRAAAEKWMEARRSVAAAVIPIPADTDTGITGGETETLDGELAEIVDLKRDRYLKFMEITDAMMDRISDALTSPEVISPYSLKLLASALRDLREMQGLNKTELDIEEQRARIEKLRSETRAPDTEEAQGVVVEFVDTFGAEA